MPAMTERLEFSTTLQIFPDAESQPFHTTNVDRAAAVAVRVTKVPLMKLAEQPLLQLMPAGELLMLPLPGPNVLTVKVGFAMNVAVTVWAAFIVTVVAALLGFATLPVQPAKVKPAFAVAVIFTTVPAS